MERWPKHIHLDPTVDLLGFLNLFVLCCEDTLAKLAYKRACSAGHIWVSVAALRAKKFAQSEN